MCNLLERRPLGDKIRNVKTSTYVTALSCGLSAVIFHELIAPLHQLDSELTRLILPREVPFADHEHRDAQQRSPQRSLPTIIATGTTVSSLQASSVFYVNSTPFMFRR